MSESGNKPSRWHHVSRVTFHVSLLLVLSGCGFHLRGSYDVPEFLHEITLRNPAATKDFDKEMRLALERSNIRPEDGEILLEITRENVTRQTSTVDSHAKAAEYTLIYTVEYRVGTLDGKTYGERQSLILRRSYQYSNTNVVGKNTEEETLIHELRVDAAHQIVRQLASMKAPPLPDGGKPEESAEAGNTDTGTTANSAGSDSSATPATTPAASKP